MRRIVSRIGETGYNNRGSKMKIVDMKHSKDVLVEFQDEHKAKVKTNYNNFCKGNVKNPFDKTVFNVGYIGIGKYSYITHVNIYVTWSLMLRRCYEEKTLETRPTYINCSVCEQWHNFQNFAQWYETNYYNVYDEAMVLDKDILIKGNKIYSPETCVFVPNRINILFTNRRLHRGNLPVGCSMHDGKIEVRCCTDKGRKFLGYFKLDQVKEAFETYKEFKEKYIKEVAEEYKEHIPIKLYEAMINYKIDIND